MKTSFHAGVSKSKGFTLIELLTVIAIIGILASIIIPVVGSARVAANKAKTKVQFSQIITAMEAFKQEYGYYPSIATAGKVDGANFAPALMGKQNFAGDVLVTSADATAKKGNLKLIQFYTPGTDDLSTASPPVLVDAFGNEDIKIRVDVNGDGKIDSSDIRSVIYTNSWDTVTPIDSTQPLSLDSSLISTPVRAGVAIYSAGRGQDSSDIVTSWK